MMKEDKIIRTNKARIEIGYYGDRCRTVVFCEDAGTDEDNVLVCLQTEGWTGFSIERFYSIGGVRAA